MTSLPNPSEPTKKEIPDTAGISHTPGPWEIEPKERRDYPLFVMSSEGDRIARCDGINTGDFVTPAQCKANANLIAAAPDMFKVLKALAYWGRAIDDDRITEEGEMDCLYEICEQAKDAIALAQGRAEGRAK